MVISVEWIVLTDVFLRKKADPGLGFLPLLLLQRQTSYIVHTGVAEMLQGLRWKGRTPTVSLTNI